MKDNKKFVTSKGCVIDWRKFQFGATLLNTREKRRELYLLDHDSFDEVGHMFFFPENGTGSGNLGDQEIEICRINTNSCCIHMQCREYLLSRLGKTDHSHFLSYVPAY